MVRRVIHGIVWVLLSLAIAFIITWTIFFIDVTSLDFLDQQTSLEKQTKQRQEIRIYTENETNRHGGFDGDSGGASGVTATSDDEIASILKMNEKKNGDKASVPLQQQQKEQEEVTGRQDDDVVGSPTIINTTATTQMKTNHSRVQSQMLRQLRQYIEKMMHLELQNEMCSKWIIYTPSDSDGVGGELFSTKNHKQLATFLSSHGGQGWCALIILTEDMTTTMTKTNNTMVPKICSSSHVYCKSYHAPSTDLFDYGHDYCHHIVDVDASIHSRGESSTAIVIQQQCRLLRILYFSYCSSSSSPKIVKGDHQQSGGTNTSSLYLWKVSTELTRRNFAYLLAISHGAESIVDLGEHYQIVKPETFISIVNRQTTSNTATSPPPSPPGASASVNLQVSVVMQGGLYFNPFPLLQNPQNNYDCCTIDDEAVTRDKTISHQAIKWPRGFPGLSMKSLDRQYSKGKIAFSKNVSLASVSDSAASAPSKSHRIGVIQFVPGGFQDLDDTLQTELDSHYTTNPLMVPSHSFAPYNMYSTLFAYDAIWSLVLPTTTTSFPQRYADTVRSYFAQCLFPDIGLRVAYMPSIVTQNAPSQPRNYASTDCSSSSNTISDRQDVSDLEIHKRIESLISYLSKWDSPFDTLPSRMEHLWKDLYSRNYISKLDVKLVQSWLVYLQLFDYKFPKLTNRRFRNVAVMGHFNYAQSPSQVDDVVFWTQKYREWFQNVVVTGPFQPDHIQELNRQSIQAFRGDRNEEGGYFQVTENLKNMLLHFKNRGDIESVMYFHDDGMVNITDLSMGQFPFPSHEIIGNYRDQRYDLSYADIRKIQDVDLANKFSYRIYPNGTVCSFNKVLCQPSVKDLYRALPLYQWGMTTKGYCGASQQSLARDVEIFPYLEDDGSLLFSSFTQSDFLHIPTSYAEEFEKLASLFLKHNVIHECAWGTIVDMIRKKYNVTVRLTMLCTSWGPKRRGKKALIERCLRDHVDYGVFHPFKIGLKENGYQGYDWAFDSVQH